MEFEWDPAKRQSNLEKHGIDFRDAARVWDGPTWTRRSDQQDEERYVAVGFVDGRLIAVVYTLREGRYRIISARRTWKSEERAYRALHPR